jgi:RnfABCDGE-type electron transport complex C subunit
VEIAGAIKNSGIVGAGGAGFPTHMKIAPNLDTVIVNGAECEPLLASDEWLMEGQSDKLVRGLVFLLEACGAKRGVIALKQRHEDALHSIRSAIDGSDKIDIFLLRDYYPAGDELILVNDVTGRIVPEGGIPPQVGCVVNNVETVLNVFESVENNAPVTKRFLTCTGDVGRPSVVAAHVGTPVGEIVELCGGFCVDDPVAVIGGPMMGSVVTDFETPVTKTTSGVIVLPRNHSIVQKRTIPVEFMVRRSKAACCQCSFCTDLCPRHLIGHDLLPHMIMRQISYGLGVPSAVVKNAFLCSECGLCSAYACTMELSPSTMNRVIKERISSEGYKPSFPMRPYSPNSMREYRRIPTSRVLDRLHLRKYTGRRLRRGVSTDPGRVEILLKQHIGAPSIPSVKRGDRVKGGDPIAEIPEETTGARVHASISGEVTLVDEERIIIER